MNKGLSTKLLFTTGALAFLGLIFLFTIGRGLLPNEAEYRKDHAWLAANMKTELPETPLPEITRLMRYKKIIYNLDTK